jgi:hypothetical protein
VWESSLSSDDSAVGAEVPAPGIVEDETSSGNPEIAEAVEEIRFYLEHFMTEQARSGMEKLESLTRDARILDPLRAALASATLPPTESEPEVTEINADESAEFECEVETPDGTEIAASPEALAGYGPANDSDAAVAASHFVEAAQTEAVPEETGVLNSLVADLEASLGDSFPQASPSPASQPRRSAPARNAHDVQPLPNWPVAAAPVAPQKVDLQPKAASAPHNAPSGIPTPPSIAPPTGAGTTAAASSGMSYSPSAARPLGSGAQAINPADQIDLSEMFGELKHELEEEVAAGDDDPETHYNLGVAFREMGLLDEAIAELQKVCNSIERGQPFAQPVQTYTWLAQCFLDKGVPAAAINWYEKALKIPGLDNEARLAINYELGSACETAMDKPAALRHFTSVYGANIDYRDVAQRIQALKS